ncbi:dihydrofolate reductase family protein [Virgibacillus oceani]|uniref:Deaminase n=1 Tax=Virgibacillus oceani TaxID=1479511 RepID=A0A917M6Q6_9BACI|nr:dihydrofolate reductase family protein [Virgibacillus oceani]GGG78552.1 deaminase [Virgibacillus oceani]
MSKIVVIEHLTLDGVMQSPGLPDEDTRDGFEYGGWAEAGNDPVMMKVQSKYMSSSWSLLVGRTTYEGLANAWKDQSRDQSIAKALSNVEKFVASTTMVEPLPWENSILLKGNIPETVAQLKKEHNKTIVIFGSGELVQSLMQHDLIDEYVLMIHPLVLGKGRRLFLGDGSLAHLKLVDSVTTDTGVIIATYRTVLEQ